MTSLTGPRQRSLAPCPADVPDVQGQRSCESKVAGVWRPTVTFVEALLFYLGWLPTHNSSHMCTKE